MIKIKDLSKSYNKKEILNIKEFSFKKTGFYFIYGRSGCGKTSLLNSISLIDNEFNGDIYIDNQNSKNKEELLRKKYISYVLQKPILLDDFTVTDNLIHFLGYSKEFIYSKLKEFDLYNIKDNLTKNISGGQKQKVVLLRTILENKPIIICDEPTGNINNEYSNFIINILKELSKEKLVIVVSHQKDLYFNICDYALNIKNKDITIEKYKNLLNKNIEVLQENYKYNKLKLKKLFIKNILEKRKIKHTFINFMLCFILIMFSLIFILKFNITNSLNDAFSNFYNENEILISSNKSNIIQNKTSVNENELNNILNALGKENNYRYFYENDFNNFFIDSNNLSFKGKYSYLNIEKYNTSYFNEFSDIQEILDLKYCLRTDLNDDEIIISINNKMMIEICLFYKIERTFDSLFEYLKNNNIYISLFVKNYSWEYEDEQIFKMVGFVVENELNIYHSNPLFNVELFETKMRLPSSIYDEAYEYPWTLKKTAVLELNEFERNKFLVNKSLNNFYINKIKWTNYSTKYDNNFCSNANKYLIYKKNKQDYFTIEQLDKIKTEKYLLNNSFFINISNNFLNGFIFNLFFSNDIGSLEYIIDNYYASSNKKFNFNNVVSFNALLKSSENLYFKYDDSIKDNEFVLSSKFKNKFNIDNTIYYLADSFDEKEYLINKINVDRFIKEDEKYVIYGSQIVISSFLRDYLYLDYNMYNYSSIKIDDSSNINFYKSLFYDSTIKEPLKEINDQINTILNYFIISLNIFSITSILLSFLLYILIISNNIFSLKKDISILYILSFSKKDILDIFNAYSLKKTAKAQLISIVFIILISFMINLIIQKVMNLNMTLSFPLITFLLTFLFSIVLFIASMFIHKSYINKLNIPLIIRD